MNEQKRMARWLPFHELQHIARQLGFKSRREYMGWVQTCKPVMIPTAPDRVYILEFPGWNAFLNTTAHAKYPSVEQAIINKGRKAAAENQEKEFFVDVECHRGHTANRRTDSGGCVVCQREASKKWNNDNKDRVYQNVRRWQIANPEKVAAYQKITHDNTKEQMKHDPELRAIIRAKRHAQYLKIRNNPKKYEAFKKQRREGHRAKVLNKRKEKQL